MTPLRRRIASPPVRPQTARTTRIGISTYAWGAKFTILQSFPPRSSFQLQGPVKVRQVPRRGTTYLAVGESDGQEVARSSTPPGSDILWPAFHGLHLGLMTFARRAAILPRPGRGSDGHPHGAKLRLRDRTSKSIGLEQMPSLSHSDLGVLGPPTSGLCFIYLLRYAKYT